MMNMKTDAHRLRMAIRRNKQLDRKPGFTPVPNGRIDAAVLKASLVLTLDESFKGDVRTEAWRIVAQTLPQLPIGRRK